MKKYSLVLFMLLFSLSAFAQADKIKGNLSSLDTADLTILNIYPDSFPHVSVIFKAQTRNGEPVWNLTREKLTVSENSQKCEVVSLEQISKTKPINLGIVIDHSGSMAEDYSQLVDSSGKELFSFDSDGMLVFPKDYLSPINNAKNAVKKFVTSFNTKKDFISITGFSNVVEEKLPLTQNISQINSLVDSMKANNSTALYDAIMASIDQIKNSNGVKIIVAMTDGQDNSSIFKWNEVVDKAIKEDIPIYIIGLGDVNKDTLQLIAKLTKGQFYFTKSSSSLNTVYLEISKQVQAFYNLVYNSPNIAYADSVRKIELSFNIDNMYLVTNPSTLNLPNEVVSFLKQKETQKEYLLYGGIIASIALITVGTLLVSFRRKKKMQLLITKLFPNPSNGMINLNYVSTKGQLQIINITGEIMKTIEINGIDSQFDLSDLQNGIYIAMIQSNGEQSNSIKFMIQH